MRDSEIRQPVEWQQDQSEHGISTSSFTPTDHLHGESNVEITERVKAEENHAVPVRATLFHLPFRIHSDSTIDDPKEAEPNFLTEKESVTDSLADPQALLEAEAGTGGQDYGSSQRLWSGTSTPRTPTLCRKIRAAKTRLRKRSCSRRARGEACVDAVSEKEPEEEERLRDSEEEAEEEERQMEHDREIRNGTTNETEAYESDVEANKCQQEDDSPQTKWEEIPDPENPARILSHMDLRLQRLLSFTIIAFANLGMVIPAVLSVTSGEFVLAFILLIKAKDCISVFISAFGLAYDFIKRKLHPPEPISPKWILTLIPAFSESEEQIVRAIFSLRDNDVEPHLQVMCVILDGRPRDVQKHMTRVIKTSQRPYITAKFKRGTLNIVAGFIEDVPVIVIEKVHNAGKKDSLILCHDLFNYPRENIPLYTTLLREEMWRDILPKLTAGHRLKFTAFDMVFCTDADSIIHKGALARLAEALTRDENAIAACGLVLVELEAGHEWGVWNLYQMLQYTFGQYVRRRAESVIGKVTCLPGCITMISVRPEMAGAIRKYAEPVTGYSVIMHQVQYLGTDRRLTYSMLSQSRKLHTIFVSDAVSETLVPQSLKHYLSQRRRWGSNAYFNNYFYVFGEKMITITRIAATMEILRASLIYYRIVNTALFIMGLVHHFSVMKLIPLLIVSQLPTIWFFFTVFVLERELRKRWFKLVVGFFINKAMTTFVSMMVFSLVLKNLGSQAWGMTGGTNAVAAPDTNEAAVTEPATDNPNLQSPAPQNPTPETPSTENPKPQAPLQKKGRKLRKRRPGYTPDIETDIERDRRASTLIRVGIAQDQRARQMSYYEIC